VDNLNPTAAIRDDLNAAFSENCLEVSGQALGRGLFGVALTAAPFAKAPPVAGLKGEVRPSAPITPPRPAVIATHDGLRLPGVPDGVTGTRVTTGKGLEYSIAPGTPELHPSVVAIRIMDPVLKGQYQYPNGYAVYMNKTGQTINPLTGRTAPRSDPYSHIPLS
jgi:hypothetical protein